MPCFGCFGGWQVNLRWGESGEGGVGGKEGCMECL